MREKVQNSKVGQLGIRMMRRGRTPRGTPEGAAAGRRLLDIGCATGEYLAYLRGLGWETRGIEFDPDAAAQARDSLRLDVITGTAESALPELPSDYFDVVTMWHVLEHLNDPHAVLTEVRRVLKPGGELLIEVPNYQSAWSTLLRGDWFPLEYPYHQHHFTPRTLRRLLNETGFQVSRMKGQAAPAETTWSLHMLWHRWRGKQWDGKLLWSPPAIIALYPIEMLLAGIGRTNHMQACAVPLLPGGA
jgi:2-polyprenyl-3-methyl-5-hydroxy-6-metoxy-1,4-benzoquinol methylase